MAQLSHLETKIKRLEREVEDLRKSVERINEMVIEYGTLQPPMPSDQERFMGRRRSGTATKRVSNSATPRT